jgi:hypothetical protein
MYSTHTFREFCPVLISSKMLQNFDLSLSLTHIVTLLQF